jgi:hypothetical protein
LLQNVSFLWNSCLFCHCEGRSNLTLSLSFCDSFFTRYYKIKTLFFILFAGREPHYRELIPFSTQLVIPTEEESHYVSHLMRFLLRRNDKTRLILFAGTDCKSALFRLFTMSHINNLSIFCGNTDLENTSITYTPKSPFKMPN